MPHETVLPGLFPGTGEPIFTQPCCKIQFLVDAGIAPRQTASEYLPELAKLGILKGERRGREGIHQHPALLKLLAAWLPILLFRHACGTG
ncbi:MAG: hypothetical protein GX450_10635 [Verrucomicrobia bacterium]|nr:hypothetical protein [Verrucomicrobiota bacterium]